MIHRHPLSACALILTHIYMHAMCRYGNNETNIPYNKPWAPHHLGYYPVGNILPSKQEDMPVEETANMLLMLVAAIQREYAHVRCTRFSAVGLLWTFCDHISHLHSSPHGTIPLPLSLSRTPPHTTPPQQEQRRSVPPALRLVVARLG